MYNNNEQHERWIDTHVLRLRRKLSVNNYLHWLIRVSKQDSTILVWVLKMLGLNKLNYIHLVNHKWHYVNTVRCLPFHLNAGVQIRRERLEDVYCEKWRGSNKMKLNIQMSSKARRAM